MVETIDVKYVQERKKRARIVACIGAIFTTVITDQGPFIVIPGELSSRRGCVPCALDRDKN